MSDVRLIDANALMEKFGDISLMLRMAGFLDLVGEAEIISMIGNAPTIEPKQEWIPCKERMPNYAVDGNIVLVNVVHPDRIYPIIILRTLDVHTYYKQKWINAWMPLPPSYKGASDDSSI